MSIIDLVRQGGFRSVSVVGLAKNAGKTVALNSMIQQADARGISLGLSTIGYDGEKTDILTRLGKPRITARVGTLVATAAATLERATARLELLGSTGFVTALGEVLIARVRETGQVEIAGPDSLQEMRQAVDRMRSLGSELVLIDGALDRVGSAAPTITEATVISTGASVGGNIKTILTRTLHKVALFTLPAVPPGVERQAVIRAMQLGQLVALTPSGVILLPFKSAMGHSSSLVDSLPEDIPLSLVLPGAVTDSLISEVSRRSGLCQRLQIIVPDPTHIFAGPEVWQKYTGLGGEAAVLNTIKVLAVTVNPTAHGGQSYHPQDFASLLATSLTPLPVYDLYLSQARV